MRAFPQWCQDRVGWWLVGVIVCVGILGLTSCTTILRPNPQPVAVNPAPPQAAVLVNGSPLGYTPTTVNLDRKLTYTLELQKPGSAPYAQMLTKTVDPMFFLNILFLPGFLVDLATGTWKQFPD